MIKWHLPRRPHFPALLWAFIISGAYFAFSLITLDDFGITWDEPVHFANGDLYLQRLIQGGPVELSPSDFHNAMENLGPFFDIISSWSYHLFSKRLRWLSGDNARHLPLVAAGALTVLFTFLLVEKIASARAAFLSSLFLITFPRFIGHSFNNPKDTPITFIFVLCLYIVSQRIISGKICRGKSEKIWAEF